MNASSANTNNWYDYGYCDGANNCEELTNVPAPYMAAYEDGFQEGQHSQLIDGL